MSTTLDGGWVLAWAQRAQAVVADNRVRLTDLDRAIGDGDHGENMARGYAAVAAALENAPADASAAQLMRTVATTLISSVGGAAGPLFGTAFLKASEAAGERLELDGAAVSELLGAACDGIVLRGRAQQGDKTMVDAWAPAAQAAREAAERGVDAVGVLAAAASAAETGAQATEPMQARKGRASYLGERSIGHRDPGAESSALILRAAADSAGAQQ
jgi:dihydroxyacetone kinase-like protein